jgi:hypothetical protein
MILVLFLISFLTRLLFLYFGHPSITHDEADYFINSYLLSKTGADIWGNKLFLTSGILNATSAIPIYLGSLIFHFFQKSVVIARLPFALLNSLTPLVFYFIIKKLTNNKIFSLIAFTVLNFSPWFSYLSAQSAFDSPISLLFYLLAFYILLLDFKPVYKYLLFLFFSFLSFNSYMGIKISFPFLIFIALLTEKIYFKKKINFKSISLNLFISLIIFIILFAMTNISPGSAKFQSRLKDKLLPFNMKVISNRVVSERSITNDQSFLKSLIFNKGTVLGSLFLERYVQAFNPYFLFIKGDQHVIYGTNYFGLFYLFDLFLLIMGFYFATTVFKNNKIIVLPFFLIFAAAAIPLGLMVDTPNISIRGYPLILPFVFFIAVGIYQILKLWLKSDKKIILTNSIIYFFSFVIFFIIFQTVIKNASADQWHLTEKQLSQTLAIFKEKNRSKDIVVYVNEPRETLLLYLFYQESNPSQIKKSLLNKNYSIGNLSFSAVCPQEKIDNTIQIIHSQRCPINTDVFTPSVFVSPVNNVSSTFYLLK